MSRAAIARLETLLARVEARRKEPRTRPALAPVTPALVSLPAAPVPVPVPAPAPAPVPLAKTPTLAPEAITERPVRVTAATALSAAPVMLPSDVPTMAPPATAAAEALRMPPITRLPSDLTNAMASEPPTMPPAARGGPPEAEPDTARPTAVSPQRFEPEALVAVDALRVVAHADPPPPVTFHGMLRRSLALRPRR